MVGVTQRAQRGVVLIMALTFLIMLIAVGVVLVNMSTFDLRLSGNSAMRSESVQASLGAIDEVVDLAQNQLMPGGLDIANLPIVNDEANPLAVPTSVNGTAASVFVVTDENFGAPIETCPRGQNPWGSNVVGCQYGRIDANHSFQIDSARPGSGARALVYQRFLVIN